MPTRFIQNHLKIVTATVLVIFKVSFQSFIDTNNDGIIDTETITSSFVGYAPYDNPEVVFTVISPDVALESTSYIDMSHINKRISQKVSQKYFEIYG